MSIGEDARVFLCFGEVLMCFGEYSLCIVEYCVCIVEYCLCIGEYFGVSVLISSLLVDGNARATWLANAEHRSWPGPSRWTGSSAWFGAAVVEGSSSAAKRASIKPSIHAGYSRFPSDFYGSLSCCESTRR
jgi:hypothetical protein